MMVSNFHRLAFQFLLALSAGSLHAAEIPKVAVVSSIGDSLTLVTQEMVTGSRLDRNQREVLPLPSAELDRFVLQQALAEVGKTNPKIAVVGLIVPNVEGDAVLVADQKFLPTENLAEALKKTEPTHLMIIVRHRSNSSLRLANSSVGSGKIGGMGFYIDHNLRVSRSDTGERGAGYLAPFAYFKVYWIDYSNGAVLGEAVVTESTTLSAARSKASANPWDALDATEKMGALKSLIARGMQRVVPQLLSQVPDGAK